MGGLGADIVVNVLAGLILVGLGAGYRMLVTRLREDDPAAYAEARARALGVVLAVFGLGMTVGVGWLLHI